ncbi:hypothetical protein LBMAG53_02170 [Planctomycetota bacterium]|nr:hypothetical protein LBMAG53_02170 [Planctomycetota bacterium]
MVTNRRKNRPSWYGRQAAFTLIEMLVVIVIIGILAGLLLSSLGIMRTAGRVTKTDTCIRLVERAFSRVRDERGAGPEPVEHPFAASAAPRPIFYRGNAARGDFGSLPDWSFTDDLALKVKTPEWLPSQIPRTVRGDDRFAGMVAAGDIPLFFGCRRDRMRALGPGWGLITDFRSLPDLGVNPLFESAGLLKSPIMANFPDRLFRVKPALPYLDPGNIGLGTKTYRQTAKDFMVYALGEEFAELQRMGLLKEPPADAPVTFASAFDRVWSVGGIPDADLDLGWQGGSWTPGMAKIGTVWKRYRLFGLAVYDSWGNELLMSATSKGNINVESAGADGVFRWGPGPDGVYQTDAFTTGTVASGDDRIGWTDNRKNQREADDAQ